MSSTEAKTDDKTNELEKTGENEKSSESSETNTSQNNNKPIKKVKSKKDLKNDPSRFDPPGVNFNAKLIGIDDVENARGDKMCQESMYRLKLAVKQSGQHKPKCIINVSLDGIRIVDLKTHAVNHTHPVHRISFISRDITDHRAFGYVYGAGEGKHKFFAIKTEKAAEALVLTLRDLFQVVYELKKKEVEDAKHKKEEAVEATEGTENKDDPVYSVPTNGKPVENDADPTYQVPNNNQPVNEAPDLLQMESELEVIERRIEQIDTMEELFKELEAPPVTTQSSAPASSSSPWSSDLAGLSMTQTQPAFSIGGSPFPNNQQPFSTGSTNPFPPTSQPFGMPAQSIAQSFGQPVQSYGQPIQAQPFGQPAFSTAGFPPQQMPGVPAFQAPSVPPRTGAGFPQQPNPFPGAPFAPQQQQAAFGAPGMMGPPGVRVTPPNDPFGADPFAGNDFEEDVLTPLSLQTPVEEKPVSKPSDAFGDLVSIGGTTNKKSPKELFVELATPAKKSLNELKAPKSPKSPKSGSPVGFQASDDVEDKTNDIFNPFGISDPFANDPFSPAPPSHNISSNTNETVKKKVCDVHDDEDFNIPLPRGPPPPLPDFISSQPPEGPPPPLRPPVETPKFPQDLPPVPPRPLSASSESKNSSGSLSSLNESQTIGPQMTPPLPPRPMNNVVPRPRPRPRSSKTNDNNLFSQTNTQISVNQNVLQKSSVITSSDKSVNRHGNNDCSMKISSSRISHDSSITSYESHSDSDSNHSVNKRRTSSVVADPFVSTDPFASDDPFTQSDPFANDPFNPDPFADISATQPVQKDDPFTSVVTNKHEQSADPFSVFDNTLSNETFKFEKSSSRKNKTKVSGI